jgi:membrane protease YdiL (CAAX protease family)
METIEKHPNSKIGIFFIVLIITEMFLLQFISAASGNDVNKYNNYKYLYATIAYTIIVLSIIIFHGHGLDVFQDHFSLLTIVFSCFVLSILLINHIVYQGIFIFLGFMLSIFIILNRKTIKMPSLKSVLIGLWWSIVSVMTISLLRLITISGLSHGTLPSNLPIYIFSSFIYNISWVTVIEEAYFRGLLFSFLVMNGWNENRALIFQAVLFCLSHFAADFNDPVLFLGIIPLLTLFETLIIKRYKMLYLTIMIHTINNVFGGILVAIL